MTPDTTTEWLARNAKEVKPWMARDAETTSWQRASEQIRAEPDVGVLKYEDEPGRYQVTLPDGDDSHELLYVEADADAKEGAGACDCEAFRMVDITGNTCAHLAAVRQKAALSSLIDIDKNERYAKNLLDSDEPEETTAEVVDVQSGPEAVNNDPTPDLEPEAEPDTPAPEPPEESFAAPIADEVPDEYAMNMNGETYIRRAGYAQLARAEGFRVHTQIVTDVPEGLTDGQIVAVGKVIGPDGELIAQDYGTAGPPGKEDMDGASHNLLELASTRAATRATAWATGEGLTAVSEVEPGEEVHSP